MKILTALIPYALILLLNACTKHEIDLEPLPYTDMEIIDTGRFTFMDFSDDMHGMAVRNSREVFVTNDGGNTWTMSLSIPNYSCEGLSFVTPDTAYVLMDDYSSSRMVLYRSIDGAFTWDSINDLQCSQVTFNFCTPQSGCYFNDNVSNDFYTTVNGGITWTLVSSGTTLYKPKFLNQNTGFAIGPSNKMYKTPNGGISWLQILNNEQCDDYALEPTSGKIFAVGQSCVVRRSDNNGTTWAVCFSDPSMELRCIDAHASGLVVAAYRGEVVVSRNFGATWEYCIFKNVSDMHDLRFIALQITGPNTILFTADNNADRFLGKIILH